MVRPVGSTGPAHGVSRRRGVRAAQRQTAIHAAALRIIRRKGYHAASIREIADAAGLNKASLYYYISSKEELLVGLFEGRTERVLRDVEAAASSRGTARDRLRAIVRSYVLGVLRNLDSVQVYLREEHSLPPAALRQVHREQGAMRALVERVITDGVRSGEFAERDTKLATLAILGACTWVHRWYRPGGRLTDTAVAEDFADRAVGMLRA